MDSTVPKAKVTPTSFLSSLLSATLDYFPKSWFSNQSYFFHDIGITAVITGNPFFCIVTLKLSIANL